MLIFYTKQQEQQPSRGVGLINNQVLFHTWTGISVYTIAVLYSEVPNRRADRNKTAGLGKDSTLPVFLLSKLINEQGGFFCLLHGKLQAGWKENLKNLSEHALLLGTSE